MPPRPTSPVRSTRRALAVTAGTTGAALALALASAGCSIGAPPGFSSGDQWSFPLVGALEEGVLLTPVFIHDRGPYLMAIDPDAPLSVLDEAVVSENQLYAGLGPRVLTEGDATHPMKMAEVRSLRLGTLTVTGRTVLVGKVGAYSAAGRQVRGVIGRDVIADSLVFGFDRDRGLGYLATQKGFTAPAGAATIGYDLVSNRLPAQVTPVGRRLAKVKVGQASLNLHLDLGASLSQLRPALWAKAGLAAVPAPATAIDEYGTVRKVTGSGVANTVTAGTASSGGVRFIAYDDRRWEEEDVDGTLGLDFFRTSVVWANWDKETYYLAPRGDTMGMTKERVGRWGSAALDACGNPGCVTVTLEQPAPVAAAEPGSGAPGAPVPPMAARLGVTVTRDAGGKDLDLDLLVRAVDDSGAARDLPALIVSLPAGADSATTLLDPAYAGARLVVVDVSPFPRACRGGGGCIVPLA